ncbi:MAG: RHS repeat-associated core domain-containing protein, partial [Armatimonadota bacterium]
RLQAMARFRNLLVHRYWQVDDAEVLRFGAGVLCYDAWGQLMVGTNSMLYGYKGQWGYYADSETGWLLLTHRYLDPTTGRFLTRDLLPMIHPLRPLRIKAYTEAGNVVEWKKPYLLKVGAINEQALIRLLPDAIAGWKVDLNLLFRLTEKGRYRVVVSYDSPQLEGTNVLAQEYGEAELTPRRSGWRLASLYFAKVCRRGVV